MHTRVWLLLCCLAYLFTCACVVSALWLESHVELLFLFRLSSVAELKFKLEPSVEIRGERVAIKAQWT